MDLGETDLGATDLGTVDFGADQGTDLGMLPEGAVATESGVVLGVDEGELRVHWAIPYAAPPLGALRFAPPAPVVRAPEPLPGDAPPPACPQNARGGGRLVGDEDCLFLNVFSPTPGEALRPVMVFIHGGAFLQGSSNVALYDGRTLVRAGDVVVVTINYRVGLAGFLVSEGLRDEGAPGNHGLRDQIAALRWLQRNVAAFGGDPEAVTLFGESAGGSSICALLAAPDAEGLFHRAIIQSGGGCTGYPPVEGAGRSGLGRAAPRIDALGCTDAADPAAELACLREVPIGELVAAASVGEASGLGLPDVGPVEDGVLLPGSALERLASGAAPDVPVISGSNADEAVTFVAAVPVPTEEALELLVRAQLSPRVADAVLALYPVEDFASPKAAYEAILGDIAFVCPALGFVRATAGGAAPSYAYHFTRVPAGLAGARGAVHGLELVYLFGRFDVLGYRPRAADEAVAAAMQQAWTAFARGEALVVAGTSWPAYDPAAPGLLLLDDPLAVGSTIREGRCDALRRLGISP